MVETLVSRAKGALVGLAIGDALGSPTEGKKRSEIIRQWGRVTDFLSDEQSGTDDTEYAMLSSRLLLKYGIDFVAGDVIQMYRTDVLNESNKYKGAGFSEMLFLQNLRSGLSSPLTGKHIHCWSDGLAMRTAVHGIAAAGKPDLAASLARREGEVAYSGEGVYGGVAVAAAVAAALGGADIQHIQQVALSSVPKDSWTHRSISEGVIIGQNSPDVWHALEPLEAAIARDYYHWSDIAPEAVGLAFGVFSASKGAFVDSVLGGVNIGRDTDTIAAIAGAISGAMNGYESLPEKWRTRVAVARGTCIKCVAGMNLAGTAEVLVNLASERGQ
jgi:ADP-ribosylglycohydrolase